MKTKWMFVSVLVLVLVLVGGTSLILARGGLLGPQRAPRAPLDDGFTYQGELIRGTTPVSETCQMAFRLYDASSGGLQVGNAITTSVGVADGLFTVALDFGASAFTGEARWLDIGVKCPSDSVFAAFPERQALTAAPYALYAKTAQQLARDFVMASGESVSAGDVVALLNEQVYKGSNEWADEAVFNPATTADIAAAVLSATDFVVAYRDDGNSGYGTVIMGTISGGTVLWGAEEVFNPASTDHIAVAALSDTDFVLAYQDTIYGKVITGTISGGTLVTGTAEVFHPMITEYIAVAALSATDFVLVYQDWVNSNYGTAITGTISGGTLVTGTEEVFNPATTASIAVAALSDTDFVVAYRDQGNSGYGTAIVGTISGGTMGFGTEEVFNPAGTNYNAIAALSDTDFAVAYQDQGNSNYGTVITGTVSGGTVVTGTEAVFNPGLVSYNSVTALSATDFVVAYRDVANSGYGTAITGTVSGGTLVTGAEEVFNPANTSHNVVAVLSDTDLLFVYRDSGNSDYGTARVKHIGRRLIGTARNAASGGETVTVVIAGVSDAHSGLTPGQMYYLQPDRTLGITPTADRVGLAISETELLLDQMW